MNQMWSHPIRRMGLTRSNLAAALFLKAVSARDAIADLKIAGFHTSDIGVALSKQGIREQQRSPETVHTPDNLEGKHSIPGKCATAFRNDAHTHGPGFTSRVDAAEANQEQPVYTEIDTHGNSAGPGGGGRYHPVAGPGNGTGWDLCSW